ncbi:hypothetical protein TB2_006832 [Malus domestica]
MTTKVAATKDEGAASSPFSATSAQPIVVPLGSRIGKHRGLPFLRCHATSGSQVHVEEWCQPTVPGDVSKALFFFRSKLE